MQFWGIMPFDSSHEKTKKYFDFFDKNYMNDKMYIKWLCATNSAKFLKNHIFLANW